MVTRIMTPTVFSEGQLQVTMAMAEAAHKGAFSYWNPYNNTHTRLVEQLEWEAKMLESEIQMRLYLIDKHQKELLRVREAGAAYQEAVALMKQTPLMKPIKKVTKWKK